MAKLQGEIAQIDVSRKGEGLYKYLKLLRDGTLTVSSWTAALSLEGRVFTANAGTETDSETFQTTALDTGEYDFHVSVPSTVVIIPLELDVVFDAFGTAGINEVAMLSGSGSTCGAGGAVTPVSSNISSGLSSACTIVKEATTTSGVAIATNKKEIFHSGNQYTITVASVGQLGALEHHRWRAMDSGILDVVGPSQQLAIYAVAIGGTGFITLKYIELPVSAAE